ncbi:MAG TPA: hypothetical protein VNX87_09855 [Candidatus Sulfotelmatobacter sp.]|jgi:REP element-mobilizing transposase RayT|nr:hypothetical protein [Candidatus Sulfotelmatobacter sp.]
MPNRLHRYYGAGYSHFITTRCYQRLPLLTNPRNRGLFLRVLELVRRRYRFVVFGYVVMPEHVQRFRRLVTRYEYHIENSLGMVRLGCMRIMLRYV